MARNSTELRAIGFFNGKIPLYVECATVAGNADPSGTRNAARGAASSRANRVELGRMLAA